MSLIKNIERRGLALAIDGLLIVSFMVVLGSLAGISMQIGFMLLFFGFFAIYPLGLVYFTVLEGKYGCSPGKKLVKIKVVTTEDEDISYINAFIRHFLDIIDILPNFWIVGITSILLTSQNRRIGDIAAGTKVVRTDNSSWGDIAP